MDLLPASEVREQGDVTGEARAHFVTNLRRQWILGGRKQARNPPALTVYGAEPAPKPLETKTSLSISESSQVVELRMVPAV